MVKESPQNSPDGAQKSARSSRMSKPNTVPPAAPDADVLFLGDTCFGASYGRASFRKRGFDSSFEHVERLLQNAAFVVANLETVLTTHETSVLEGKKSYIHKDDPEAAAALKRHGIDLVSLANNHAFDYGAPGLVETLESLGEADITVIGAGLTLADASRAHVQNVSLKESTFRLAITAGKAFKEYDYDYYAGDDQAGINGYTKRSVAVAQIRSLRAAEPNAFIIESSGAGVNFLNILAG